MHALSRLVVWQVWSPQRPISRFFAARREAEAYIAHHFGDVHLHPNDLNHAWTRENYGGMMHHPDGLHLWIGWGRNTIVHLERHEIDPTAHSVARALNDAVRFRLTK